MNTEYSSNFTYPKKVPFFSHECRNSDLSTSYLCTFNSFIHFRAASREPSLNHVEN